MIFNVSYEKQSCKKIFSGKEYIITDSVPKLSQDEKQKIKNDIQGKLFDVFKKYV